MVTRWQFKHEGSDRDRYEQIWCGPEAQLPRALWAADLNGEKCAVIGNRKDGRDLLLVRYVDGEYTVDAIDHDLGPANCMVYRQTAKDILLLHIVRQTSWPSQSSGVGAAFVASAQMSF